MKYPSQKWSHMDLANQDDAIKLIKDYEFSMNFNQFMETVEKEISNVGMEISEDELFDYYTGEVG